MLKIIRNISKYTFYNKNRKLFMQTAKIASSFRKTLKRLF